MSDYISRDELLELYPFDPDCEGCSVPYPIVRQNILDMPAADVIERTAAVNAVLGLTITDERVALYMMISLEQVERMRSRWITVAEVNGKQYSKCAVCQEGLDGLEDAYDFCPHCGAPMTGEAVQILLKRLEALKDG